jgi:tRNA nucleotidyltransferase (CCA-adding enzyme)
VLTVADIPREVLELCRSLSEKGYRAWVVGGCLRDLLLGKVAADWDLATDARPEQVQRVFPKVLPTGIAHGTVTVRHRGRSFEVTTLRGEGAYTDGRRPDSVRFVSDIEQDLARRDFTVNALAFEPLREELVDPFDGRGDLARKLIRAVGDPQQRFSEDGLRVLRAARFCATLEFALERATEAAIAGTLETFRRVSAERVRDEWLKALRAARPSPAFEVMARTGILAVTFPELNAVEAGARARALAAVDACPCDAILRLAACFWPLHGALDCVGEWLVRYRFSNHERERVLRLLRFATPDLGSAPSDGALRRAAHAMERPHLAEIGRFNALLARVAHGSESAPGRAAEAYRERLEALAGSDVALSQKELALSGRDLMAELGVAPGPVIGSVLHALLERVLDEPELNRREVLLELARELV